MTKRNDLANIVYDTLFKNTQHKQFEEIMEEIIDHMINNSNDTISFNWNGTLYTMKVEEEA